MPHWFTRRDALVAAAAPLLWSSLAAAPPRHADQDKPVRTVAEVRAVERAVLRNYAAPELAAAGILDVTKAPYKADPTGKSDSTRALQQAMKDARDARLVTYLPGGTYKVSDTLTCIQGIVRGTSFRYPCVIGGPSEGGRAKLVLTDAAPGFGDADHPKPVIHFWARSRQGYPNSSRPPTEPQPNISFDQTITNLDIDLGHGNFGAVGIDHQAAQGSTIEDVTIYARDGFAGVDRAPGSGGGTHGLTVIGGRYGLYLPPRTTQPMPIFTGLTLVGQTDAAILCHGNGPMTVVGAWIEGAGIRGEGPASPPWYGALNLVDAVIRYRKSGPAIATRHSLVLDNVYVENAAVAAEVNREWKLKGEASGWTHIVEYAAAAVRSYPGAWLRGQRRDAILVDRQRREEPFAIVERNTAAPDKSIRDRHRWRHPFPGWDSAGAVNVKQPPYSAAGDGKTDDAGAIQRAIDDNRTVFLPRGEYKISRPLELGPASRLIGLGNVLSVISPLEGAAVWTDPDNRRPLVETVDDPDANTVLAFVGLRASAWMPGNYALRWRAGRRSVVRDVRFSAGGWQPLAPVASGPQIRIEGAGGGRWYDFNNGSSSPHAQGPDFRRLLIAGASQPLAFYTFNVEHGLGTTMVEIRDARNIDMFAMKGEGDYTALLVDGCHNIRLFGYGGNGMPRGGWPLIDIRDTTDFLITHINPMFKPPRHAGRLGTAHNPALWFMLRDAGAGAEPLTIPGSQQVALYQAGRPRLSPATPGRETGAK